MKTDLESDILAREVVADVASSDFREATLALTLGEARRQRKCRRRRRTAMWISASFLVLAGLLFLMMPGEGAKPNASDALAPAVAQVRMVPGTSIRELSDEELLAMFPDRPIAMVKAGHEQRLLFLDELK